MIRLSLQACVHCALCADSCFKFRRAAGTPPTPRPTRPSTSIGKICRKRGRLSDARVRGHPRAGLGQVRAVHALLLPHRHQHPLPHRRGARRLPRKGRACAGTPRGGTHERTPHDGRRRGCPPAGRRCARLFADRSRTSSASSEPKVFGSLEPRARALHAQVPHGAGGRSTVWPATTVREGEECPGIRI